MYKYVFFCPVTCSLFEGRVLSNCGMRFEGGWGDDGKGTSRETSLLMRMGGFAERTFLKRTVYVCTCLLLSLGQNFFKKY